MGHQAKLAVAGALLLSAVVSPAESTAACPNEAVREGASAQLPDCRAYELVTPSDTNGVAPNAAPGQRLGGEGSPGFASPPASPDGDSFLFEIGGTSLDGTEGNGVANVYRAGRGPAGWHSSLLGPTGDQATVAWPQGFSNDHAIAVFSVGHRSLGFSGALDTGAQNGSTYFRSPGSTLRLLGEGTLPAGPDADGNPNGLADEVSAAAKWVSPGGGHIIFQTIGSGPAKGPVRLLPDAPPDGVEAVYDRMPGGLRLVSVLPEGVVPATDSVFRGASADGSVVLFATGGELYARVNGETTRSISESGVVVAGVSQDGQRVFYVAGGGSTEGSLVVWDVASGASEAIASTGDAGFVSVAADGSNAYFVSPSRLDPPKGTEGSPNLYVWDGETTRFVVTLDPGDLARAAQGLWVTVGLAQWPQAVAGRPMLETSRSTPDGDFLAFESSARLTSYDNAGEIEIYRYDDRAGTILCVSCGSAETSPQHPATLASYDFVALGTSASVPNLDESGLAIVFQTANPLVPIDQDDASDVYEWRQGRLSLLSVGTESPSRLLATTPSGRDVFFRTADDLLADGRESGIAAVYDARVNGGFAEAAEGSCPSCAVAPGAPPALPRLKTARRRHRWCFRVRVARRQPIRCVAVSSLRKAR